MKKYTFSLLVLFSVLIVSCNEGPTARYEVLLEETGDIQVIDDWADTAYSLNTNVLVSSHQYVNGSLTEIVDPAAVNYRYDSMLGKPMLYHKKNLSLDKVYRGTIVKKTIEQ